MVDAVLAPVQVERRNRLRLLQPWLEAMVSTGNTETATHNAIGKIYVTLNKDPVTFLTTNQFYDPKVHEGTVFRFFSSRGCVILLGCDRIV